MDITTLAALPTDSLYKFMALSGIALTMISVALPMYFMKQLRFQIFEVRRDIDTAKLYSNRIRAKNDALGMDVNKKKTELLQQAVRLVRSQGRSEDIDVPETEELSTTVSEIEKETFEESVRAINTECNLKKVEYLSAQTRALLVVQVLGLSIGAALAVSGFSLWYTRLQVHVDATVLREAESPNHRLEPTSGTLPRPSAAQP